MSAPPDKAGYYRERRVGDRLGGYNLSTFSHDLCRRRIRAFHQMIGRQEQHDELMITESFIRAT